MTDEIQARTAPDTGLPDLTTDQISVVNDMIHAWVEDKKQYREAFRHDCKRLLATVKPVPAQCPGLPSAETMLNYASFLEKPKFDVRNGIKYPLPNGEATEAAIKALRFCAAASSTPSNVAPGFTASWDEELTLRETMERGALKPDPSTHAPAQCPVDPTQAMLDAARDWSREKYGKPIGNDAATGCWKAMMATLGTAGAVEAKPYDARFHENAIDQYEASKAPSPAALDPVTVEAAGPSAEQLAVLVRYLESQSDRLTKALDNPNWTPRRSHAEGDRNAFLAAANTLDQALRASNADTSTDPTSVQHGADYLFDQLDKLDAPITYTACKALVTKLYEMASPAPSTVPTSAFDPATLKACADMAQRWSDEAAEFKNEPRCELQSNVCRNLAQAIRNLSRVTVSTSEPDVSELADVAEAHFLPIVDGLRKALKEIEHLGEKVSQTGSLTVAIRMGNIAHAALIKASSLDANPVSQTDTTDYEDPVLGMEAALRKDGIAV